MTNIFEGRVFRSISVLLNLVLLLKLFISSFLWNYQREKLYEIANARRNIKLEETKVASKYQKATDIWFDRILNRFNTVGYALDDGLSLNIAELDDFTLHLNSVFNTYPETIVYNKQQTGRIKFRFHERKNNGKIALSLLLQLKKLLNKPIWLCQSILKGQKSASYLKKVLVK